MSAKPKLIVFDLDFTLWPLWLDHHTFPPFRKSNGQVVDSNETVILHYKEVPDLLKELKHEGYLLGVASRTSDPKGAQELLTIFDWDQYFSFKEMYPGNKTQHFSSIHKNSGIPYSEMIFFDDEYRNIADISKLGVKCVLVEDGVSFDVVKKGLKNFKSK